MEVKTSSKCWGYSRKPRNWRKYYEVNDDEANIYEIIAENNLSKCRNLSDEEIKELGLQNHKPDENHKPITRPITRPINKPINKPIDSSTSYT